MKLTSRAALVAAATGILFVAQTEGAFAQRTLLDLLLHGNDVGPRSSPAQIDASDPEPLPRVKSPRYFTYKPDARRLIKVPDLAGPVLTGAITQYGDASTDASAVSDASADAPAVSAAPTAPLKISIRADDDVASAIEAFYAKGDNYIWIGADGINDRAREAMDVLAKAADVGLNPYDYKVALPEASDDPTVYRNNLLTFEIGLSNAVLTYVQDDVRGRIAPDRISEYYDFKRKKVDLKEALQVISSSPDITAYLDSRTPSNNEFKALQAELLKLRQEKDSAPPPIEIADGTFIKPGASNPELVNVVAAIRRNGSDQLKTDNETALTGYQDTPAYTPDLVALVKGFQKEKGLKPDGIVGKATIRALEGGDTVGEKIEKVTDAMEQLRWLPDDLGARRVFINQPAYMAYYYDDNQQKLAMKVVVGQVRHQTYFFEDKIETVEFNPYWGVPRSIIVNEMLPKLRQDPSYLDRLGYEVSYKGREVSSSSIDWYRNPNVDVRQPPGSGNALGQLKILFPNSHSIYMHDTPSKSLFKRDIRALSHGCVRLSDPRGMAAAVLGSSREQVASDIATGKNMSVPLPQKIPVYIAYFTAWPDQDGKINYYDDVYKRDMYLQRAIDATSASRAES